MNHKKQTFSDLPTAKQLENELIVGNHSQANGPVSAEIYKKSLEYSFFSDSNCRRSRDYIYIIRSDTPRDRHKHDPYPAA